MLDNVRPWGIRVRSYRSSLIHTTVCDAKWQTDAYFRLRFQVFVDEQGLFEESDRDQHDDAALPIVALSTSHGMPDQVVGVVRVYPVSAQDGEITWYGGRLAVDREYRRHGIVGERLIKHAVGTARALGCTRFLATVQGPNVRYFERHHFEVLERLDLYGTPHALMQARVACFDPCPLPSGGRTSELAA